MKLRFYLVLVLICGCDPAGAFVAFTPSLPPDTDGGVPVIPIDEDAGATPDMGVGGAPSMAEDGGESDAGAGGAVGAGGRVSTGGGAPTVGVGGAVAAGGAADAGGAPDVCARVTHTSGIGLTWQDCVPLGTYNEEQAMRACKASGAPECRATNCGVGNLVVCGYNAAYVYGCWGYTGKFAGYAKERNDSCFGFDWSWG